MAEVTFQCPLCGNAYDIHLTDKQYKKYVQHFVGDPEHRPHVQEIFPELSANVRESFITKLCLDCQKQIFGDDDDE